MKKHALWIFLLAACSPAAPENSQMQPLRILIVNDDGLQSQSSKELFHRLKAKGFEVYASVPLADQSGAGTQMTVSFNKENTYKYEQPEENFYAFDGSPADALLFGLSAVMAGKQPDLVISGPNAGNNIGFAQFYSGTVAAAALALRLGLPALAVSVHKDFSQPQWEANATRRALDLTVSIAEAQQKALQQGGSLFPPHAGWSVNYPAVESRPKGARLVLNSYPESSLLVRYEKLNGQTAAQEIDMNSYLKPPKGSDTEALLQGYVVFTPLAGNWNAPDAKSNAFKKALKTFKILSGA